MAARVRSLDTYVRVDLRVLIKACRETLAIVSVSMDLSPSFGVSLLEGGACGCISRAPAVGCTGSAPKIDFVNATLGTLDRNLNITNVQHTVAFPTEAARFRPSQRRVPSQHRTSGDLFA